MVVGGASGEQDFRKRWKAGRGHMTVGVRPGEQVEVVPCWRVWGQVTNRKLSGEEGVGKDAFGEWARDQGGRGQGPTGSGYVNKGEGPGEQPEVVKYTRAR